MSGTETEYQDDTTTGLAEPSAWYPGPDVLHHSGHLLPQGRDYFVAAPAEIGDVLTASSTLRADKRPMPGVSRLLLCGMIGSLGWALVHFAAPEVGPIPEWLVGAALIALTYLLTIYRGTCSYVGRLGVARFTCSGRRDRIVRAEVFAFETADELRSSQIPLYHQGVYAGTQYVFTWTDLEGHRKFRLSGTYRGENRPPKIASPFHLAESAADAWSQFRMEKAIAELERDGSIRFKLGGGDWLAVGPGFLDLNIKGEEARCEASEIAGVTIRGGTFEIRRKDAQVGWFSKTGVFRFEYSKMANARLFLMAVIRLLGVPIS